jgi:hypothetical protein
MNEIVAALRESVDWIIVDSPPLLAVADAGVIARWADGVLIVTRVGSSTRDAGRKGRELLDHVGARVVGVVEWGIGPQRGSATAGYYGSYYNAYYTHYASETPGTRAKKGKKGEVAELGTEGMAPPPDRRRSDPGGKKPMGRRIADFVGGLMLGLASFMAVLLVAAAILYGLDRAFGWGIVSQLLAFWP